MNIPNNSYEAVECITKRLGLPKNFVINLLGENDWSFIIKVHALMEAAVIQAIENSINEHSLRKYIEKLTMRNLLEMAEELKAIEPKQIIAIRQFSKIRNDIVHDVTKYSFTFKDYLSNTNNKNGFKSIFLRKVTGTVDIEGKKIESKKLLVDNPKLAVIEFLIELLVEVYFQEAQSKLKLSQLKLGESLLKLLKKSNPDDG